MDKKTRKRRKDTRQRTQTINGVCNPNRKKLCMDIGCNVCKPKRLINHPRILNHPDHELDPNGNVGIILTILRYGTRDPLDFVCKKTGCYHKFNNSGNHITSALDPQGCPYCAGKKRCTDKKCEPCNKRKFSSHWMAEYWHEDNKGNPEDYALNDHDKFKFRCPNGCPHTFESALYNITGNNTGCPYCSGNLLCTFEKQCEWCAQFSFDKHPMSKYWSKKNTKKPWECRYKSHDVIIFDCPNCEKEYKNKLYHVANNVWCPCTKNKTERKLFDWLKMVYPEHEIKTQKQFEWCKKQKLLSFDFCFDKFKLIIELDGRQHFQKIYNDDDLEKTQEYDKYKMTKTAENEYTMIRIFQEDVFNDKPYDWRKELKNSIDNVINNKVKNTIFIGNVYTSKYIALVANINIELINTIKKNQNSKNAPIFICPIKNNKVLMDKENKLIMRMEELIIECENLSNNIKKIILDFNKIIKT